jgi:hypothetical protein
MDGNMVDLVPDPVGRSSYYQCADVVIVPGAADASPAAADAGPVAAEPGASDGGAVAAEPGASDSGCSLGGPTSQAHWPALGAASLLVLARRLSLRTRPLRRRRAAR